MLTLRSTLLPLLLLLTSGGSPVYAGPDVAHGVLETRGYSDLTPDQLKKIDEVFGGDEPECIATCGPENNNRIRLPPCAYTNSTKEEDQNDPDAKNAWNCLCTDKPFLADQLGCFVKECSSNATAFDIALNIQYGTCKLYADVNYPSPKVFLNDLCLLDDLAKGASVPTDVALVKSIWPDYTFAKDFPKKTATTWMPTDTPNPLMDNYSEPAWTCTPTPLADQGDTSSTGSSVPVPTGSSNITSKGNSTTTRDQGAASNERQGSGTMGLAAVAAAVAGLAIFL